MGIVTNAEFAFAMTSIIIVSITLSPLKLKTHPRPVLQCHQ